MPHEYIEMGLGHAVPAFQKHFEHECLFSDFAFRSAGRDALLKDIKQIYLSGGLVL